jgi:hypothetical protein
LILSPPPQLWYCQKCNAAARTVDAKVPMHPCPGMAGLLVPLAREGTKVGHVATEREDYVGKEIVQTDADGRVIQNVITKRDDGEDCTVYAPTAHLVQE